MQVTCLIFQTSKDGIYLTRHIGLKLGVPVPVPALTVNRLCGSGFQAVINAAQVMLCNWLNEYNCQEIRKLKVYLKLTDL